PMTMPMCNNNGGESSTFILSCTDRERNFMYELDLSTMAWKHHAIVDEMAAVMLREEVTLIDTREHVHILTHRSYLTNHLIMDKQWKLVSTPFRDADAFCRCYRYFDSQHQLYKLGHEGKCNVTPYSLHRF
ncbi:hypothetical protein PENTCL1PPCAC_29144, partial [Pristionchus entomophagus]